jgi:hypothetical protein
LSFGGSRQGRTFVPSFMKLLVGLTGLLVFSAMVHAQERPSFTIRRASGPIVIDGKVDEETWAKAEVTSELIQQFPNDSARSRVRTEFRAAYDDHFIYVGVTAYDNEEGGYVVSSLRRDFRGPGLDGVSVIFDPFQDVTNGFFFGVSPYGVQREGLISNGYLRSEDLDLSWDNKWFSETYIGDKFYMAEFAIPLKTLRFKEGSTRWNVKYYRQDSKENERAIWPRTPRNFEPGSLNFTGEMNFDQPLKGPGPNISVIPYMAGRVAKDYLAGTPAESEFEVGGDAKIALTSSLNLDLTVNPDFSQVEVDRQVTNLQRFEIFFPERRQFFLENADLFSSYGHIYARPFFSRRIGVSRDTITGQNVQNPILFGARLSGNLNKYWRVGFLNMQTAEIPEANIPSYNHTVATAQRRVGSNSNVRAIFVNRQLFGNDSLDFRPEGYFYNRVAGLDYNYNFMNNKWTGNVFIHKQFTPESPGDEYAQGASVVYSTRHLNWFIYQQRIGANYRPADGFVPRSGYKRVSPQVSYTFYPDTRVVNSHGPMVDVAVIWDDVYGYTDGEYTYGYEIRFQNQSSLELGAQTTYTFLFDEFDPTNSPDDDNAVPLPAETDYLYTMAGIEYQSDPRKAFTLNLESAAGQYFNGTRYSLEGNFNFRFQPYGQVSLDLTYNHIALPAPYATSDIYLVGPRLDLTLSRSVFFTSYFQYNSQYNNVNINTRFQWRFRPVSDLFIVYTDNYFYTFDEVRQYENFSPKNRALVVKLTYWLNL